MSQKTMLEVLEKGATESSFYAQLVENPEEALKDFDLTTEEKAALLSGDVRFIKSRNGKILDEKLINKVLMPLLSRERWQ